MGKVDTLSIDVGSGIGSSAKLTPILVVNGKQVRFTQFEKCVCLVEVPPTGWAKEYVPGGRYIVVHTTGGQRFIMHGSPLRTVLPDSREVYSIEGPKYG